jgi:serine/threonine protein kinase
VFCLGALLFELLTGQPAFDDESMSALLVPPPEPATAAPTREVPEALAAIVRGALRFDPSERTASAVTVRDALAAWLDRSESPAPGAASAAPPEAEAPPREFRWRLADLQKAAETLQARIDDLASSLDES